MDPITPEQTNLISAIEKYTSSCSKTDLLKISDYVRISLAINPQIFDFIKAYLQVQIDKFGQENNDNASQRFAYYDILTDLCRNFGILTVLSPETLKLILSEINIYSPLETATAIQTIFDLCQLKDFDQVKGSSQEAVALLEELFLKIVETVEKANDQTGIPKEDQIYVQDDLSFLISITKLVTIFNPKLLLNVKKFDSFNKNYIKVYLESLAFITKQAKFDEFNVNLTEHIVNLIKENIGSINQNDQFFGLLACEYLSVHDFEKLKIRIFELISLPDNKIRLQALKVFATRSKYLPGCKSVMRIIGFLDWLLVKSTEIEKSCAEVKFDIVNNVEKFARNELKLHSKIQLDLKRYIKDGAFYNSTISEVRVLTEEA